MSRSVPTPPFALRVPQGDNREREVCGTCGFVNYVNPKVVVGAVIAQQDRILLCRRAIHPRKGYWTIPAGYLEERETTEHGARREAMEEAMAEIDIEAMLAVYNIPRISQVQIIYKARLAAPQFGPGPESLETRLFAWDVIPWHDLAFPSVHWALGHFREVVGIKDFSVRGNPPGATGEY
jgi:ADP-ribose pyrophosphatase YjhB (NUDIX family)